MTSHLEELDAFIVRYSEHWRLERMTIVDRKLLRLAVYELLYQPQIPPKVVINEAVEMAKRYGSEGTGGFVNDASSTRWVSMGQEDPTRPGPRPRQIRRIAYWMISA